MALQAVAVSLDKYPFLTSVREFLARVYGVGSIRLVAEARRDLVEKALARLEHAIRRGSLQGFTAGGLEHEVVSFHLALVMVALAGDKWLASRLAIAEAERVQPHLEVLSKENPHALEQLAQRLGLPLRYLKNPLKEPIAVVGSSTIIYREYPYAIHFVDYVKAARRLIGDPQWKPVNLPVWKGYVYLDPRRAARLVKEAVVSYIEQLVKTLPEDLLEEARACKPLQEAVEKLAKILEDYRSKAVSRKLRGAGGQRFQPPQGVIVEEAFPPCMKELIARARAGENLSHHERFALATFLLNLGAEVEEVIDVFRNMPDFNEKTTRYQVEHLAGLRGSMKKYRVYGCEKMKSLGLCRGECGTRSPIGAYYRMLRRILQQREEKHVRGEERAATPERG